MLGKKKAECDECGRRFASDVDLMNHKQIFHGKDLMYDCRRCGAQFASMEAMRAHLQRVHSYGGGPERAKDRPARRDDADRDEAQDTQ